MAASSIHRIFLGDDKNSWLFELETNEYKIQTLYRVEASTSDVFPLVELQNEYITQKGELASQKLMQDIGFRARLFCVPSGWTAVEFKATKEKAPDEERERSLISLRDKFVSYSELSDDWDYDGALAPHAKSITDAKLFINQIPEEVPVPYPEVGRMGDVGIFWKNVGVCKFAEIMFEGDGMMTYIATEIDSNGDLVEHGEEGIDVNDRWPPILVQLLTR
ncbi:MAG: hypothetical protein OXC80_04245 [Gammaproteobacteria bacterium]|nr:hypothetical protein [Gammaproteobacteria bacterium]